MGKHPVPSDVDAPLSAVRASLRKNWATFLTQGIVLTVIGLLAVIWPQYSTLAVDICVGWLFLLAGLVGLAGAFYAPSTSDFIWVLLSAALSLFAGVLLLWHPVAGAISLTLVLVAFFLVEAIFQMAMAVRYRHDLPSSWGWLLVSGLVDLALAMLIGSGWPGTSAWALGLLVGVNLVSTGLAILVLALQARRVAKTLGSTVA